MAPCSFNGLPLWHIALLVFLTAMGFTKTAVICSVIVALLWYIKDDESPVPPNDFTVNIIGGGFSGIAMALRLQKMGIRYTVYEMAPTVGGVWCYNNYPGCACDIPSHVYSLSSVLKSDWTRQYAPRHEILEYLQYVVKKCKLNVKCNMRCISSKWHPDRKMHSMVMSNGETIWSNFVVSAVGGLREPVYPEVPGIDKFEGKSFHSVNWATDYDYADKTVAVIGTGASAVQIIPTIAKKVKRLFVFQRSPCWSPKKFDFIMPEWVISIFRSLPPLVRIYRNYLFLFYEMRYFFFFRIDSAVRKAIQHVQQLRVRHIVKDLAVARKLSPNYTPGCKQFTPSDYYFHTFNRDNVTLVDTPISEVDGDGVRTTDGSHYSSDVIVYATGFSPIETGRKAANYVNADGISFAEALGDRPAAYYGVCMERFYNAFGLLGPNSGLGHNSALFMIECQVNYVSQCIRHMIENDKKTIVVKSSTMARFKEFLEENMPKNVFFQGCSSWYKNKSGENYVMWPSSAVHFWWLTRKNDPIDFDFES